MSPGISSAPKRRYRRRMVRIEVNVRPADGCADEDDFVPFDALATTLGAGGLFVATPTPFLDGHPLALRFALPSSGEVHEITGRVVWSNTPRAADPLAGEREDGASAGMGIEFVDRVAVARLARELESDAEPNPGAGRRRRERGAARRDRS